MLERYYLFIMKLLLYFMMAVYILAIFIPCDIMVSQYFSYDILSVIPFLIYKYIKKIHNKYFKLFKITI